MEQTPWFSYVPGVSENSERFSSKAFYMSWWQICKNVTWVPGPLPVFISPVVVSVLAVPVPLFVSIPVLVSVLVFHAPVSDIITQVIKSHILNLKTLKYLMSTECNLKLTFPEIWSDFVHESDGVCVKGTLCDLVIGCAFSPGPCFLRTLQPSCLWSQLPSANTKHM